MGSRGRSIRLRIYFLVAIPLFTMLGLFGYVAYTSVTNWLNLDRAPSLIQATSEPLTNFVTLLQAERRAAVVYEAKPTSANLTAYQGAIKTTKNGLPAFEDVVDSPATTGNATASETSALAKMVKDVTGMDGLRQAVTASKLGLIPTLQAYSQVIADQVLVFQAEANSMTETISSSQGLGLISAVNAREDVSEQDAVLAGALAANSLTGDDRAAFGLAYGRQFQDTQLYQKLLSASELRQFNATFNAMVPPTVQTKLANVQQAVTADFSLPTLRAQGLSTASWQLMTSTWQKANFQAATDAATATLGVDQGLASSAKNRVWVTAGVGALGLILTLIVTLLLGRSINRRLTLLRRSALTLAEKQLPSVVARLRRGESVDVAAEAPPLRDDDDEIGQVGKAIDTVRQTAIRSAIDEARVRQGVNDMFRNLARRNQSLLQRQLTVLDEAERRTTDPDVLEDLFKMDHLTTRMRRHAEGLIILSGAPPGRSWSTPVKLIDVMRGAVSEVEDYARVTVSTQARTALAGGAVTDVIHLLAELIENATTLSPPFTQVRVSGEAVANGFAIEIEDRGLGMNPQRLQELNERLANPPDINPANTEQLGLFVVGQLARRHGIRVMLCPSPYGGTTAVLLIPQMLIVEEGPAAITAGGRAPVVANPVAANGSGQHRSSGPNRSPGGGYANGARTNNGWRPDPEAGAPAATGGAPWRTTPGSGYPSADGGYPAAGSYPTSGGYPTSNPPVRAGGYAAGGRDPEPTPSANPGPRRGRHGSPQDVPVVTGVPVTRSTTTQPGPGFDVFTPLDKPEQNGSSGLGSHQPPPYADFTGQPNGSGGPQTDRSYADPFADPKSTSYQGDGVAYGATSSASYGNDANIRNNGDNGNNEASFPDGGSADGAAETSNGLPRRVRQANLAPQLRASTAADSPKPPTGVPQATAASLTDMRNTLSAMQRGWQQGRSQAQRDNEGSVDGQ